MPDSLICRCGLIHTGPYALEETLHHECLHQTPLSVTVLAEKEVQAVCPLCGNAWIGEIDADFTKEEGGRS